MKKYQKMMIIGLLVLALLPGFVGVVSAYSMSGTCYIDDGTHKTDKTYDYGCQVNVCVVGGTCNIITGNANGVWSAGIGTGLKTYTAVAIAPTTGWSTDPLSGYTSTAPGANAPGKNFWFTPVTAPSFTPAAIVGTIEPGGSEQDTITVTAGAEQITQLQLEYNGPVNSFQVVSDPSAPFTLAPGVTQTFQVIINSKAGIDPGVYTFSIDVYDKNYYGAGLHRVVMSIPVTKTVPEPVPIPEFPTVAVSILTISGMVIAVQFMKKRN